MNTDQIIAIRDAHLPSQGEAFDCLTFGRDVANAERANPQSAGMRC